VIDKAKEIEKLSKELCGSLSVRREFDLPMEGVVTVQIIKPSGASMQETHRHIVHIRIDDELVTSLPLPEYNERMNKS